MLRQTCVFASGGIYRSRNALFFMLAWDKYRFDNKHVGTSYAECVFVRTGHEIAMHYLSCSGRPGVVSMKSAPGYFTSNSCFSSSDIWGSHSAFGCVPGMKHQRTIFHDWVERV
jgi:hypothetical protein